MRRITPKTILIAITAVFAALTFAEQGWTQSPPQTATGRDMNREKAIWQGLEKVAPKSVETFKAATEAFDKRDYEQAAKLYRQVMEKAPDFDPVYRRLGSALALSGKNEEGLGYLERAHELNPSPENLSTLARFLDEPGEGRQSSQDNKQRALEFAKKALALYQAQNRRDDPDYAITVAQIAFELNNVEEARAAVTSLVLNHPDLMQTHYFLAIIAAYDEDWEKAVEEINLARSLGLPAATAQRFLDSGVHTRAQTWRYVYYSLYFVGAWVVGLGLLFTLGKLFSNFTLRSIEEADPNGATGAKEISLRSRYKRLINIAGAYYYISLPVVVFLVLLVAGSIFYAFFMIGWIPIKLLLIVAIAALVTIYKMIRSLFVKIVSEDPGRALKPEEAQGLWDLTREVAEAVGTRPIDEIRVTPGCDLAVYEKGGFREKLQDRAKRILILGVGALNGMRQNAFRAVLAHEYGHFSHRDTAGGDVALRVDRDMMKFAYAMAMAGQAVWWNVAFQFLRVYHFIFRRITHGATRLQEILADRVAVRNYGAESFEEGLRHVIRREVEFNRIASKEIEDATQARRDLKNLYQLQVSQVAFYQQMIETEINDIITRQTTEDDTHPSPVDRFRLAQRIACNTLPSSNAMVWDLFASPESLTAEMSKLIDDRVKEATTA
ncbi:MAG TPA: tetratricopeptide repeat protein [Blastocatellia bacterium]|nr:tetratricopeptide repeat protein [Blastocatellia bacterium]